MRIKRMKGLTNQIKNLKKMEGMQRDKERERIINRVLSDYTQSGFRLNDKPITLTELSEFIGISGIECMRRMNRLGEHLMGDKNNTFQVLLANTMASMLETRGLSMAQVRLLLSSQSDSYVPYVSGTVNDAIRLLLSSDSNFLSLLKMVAPTQTHGPSTIIHNNPVGQQLVQNNLMNVNDAVKLIDSNRARPLLEDLGTIDALGIRYLESGTPEILATKQKGSATDGGVRPKKKLKVHEIRTEDDGEIINPEIK